MNLPASLWESPTVYRLGWTLLHSLWQGLAVALLLWVTLAILRKRSASLRYDAGCVAMLGMIGLSVATFLRTPPPVDAPVARIVATNPPRYPRLAPPKVIAVDRSEDAPTAADTLRSPIDRSQIALRSSPITTPIEPARPAKFSFAAVEQRGLDFLTRASPWLVLAWLIGVLLMSIWNLGAWIAVQQLKTLTTKPVSNAIEELATKLSNRLGLERRVRLLASAVIDSPLVIGMFRPAILLPVSVLTDLPIAHLEALLAHELAHVRRHDYFVNLLQSVIETLLFYHPAVWWISARIRAERENCCDDLAVAVTRDRATYVRALASVAGAKVPLLVPAASGGELLPRLRRLLGKPDADSARSSRWLAGAAALSLCVAGIFVAAPRKATAQDSSTRPTTQPVASGVRLLNVTVIDKESGRPIADANLRPYIGEKNISAVTDVSGRGRLELPNDTVSMNLWVRKDGYAPTVVVWNKKFPIPSQYTVPIERSTVIGGAVVDEKGVPVGGAKVSLSVPRSNNQPEGEPVVEIYDVSIVTDANGKWTSNIIPKDTKAVALRLQHAQFISDVNYRDSTSPSIEQLHNRSAVSVMQRGVNVAGRVIDVDGKPVADAVVSLGGRVMGIVSPTAQTNQEGRFKLPQCRPGSRERLIVTAKNHAPQMTDFTVDKEIDGLEIRLENPQPLVIQVTDPKGAPIADARVLLQRWRGADTIWWDTHTDATGTVTWVEAPPEGANYCVAKEGYVQITNQFLKAGPGPQVVKLYSELKIAGTVVDDVSGAPVKKFDIVRGWVSSGSRIFWEHSVRDGTIRGSGGKFDLIENTNRDGYAVRIEADGYLPAESKVYHMEDGQVSLDFRLKTAANLAATLVSPDGKPLVGADVLVVTPTTQVNIKNGTTGNSTFALSTKTDENGLFRLPPQSGNYLLMVLHEHGYAELWPEQLAGASRITVPAWGKIEGKAWIGAKPASGQTIVTQGRITKPSNQKPGAGADFSGSSIADEIKTDADGHFVLAHVPPGRPWVGIEVQYDQGGGSSMVTWTQRVTLDVEAGKTTAVSLGGKGRPVIGHMLVPPSLAGQVDWYRGHFVIQSKLHLPGRVLPPNWDKMDEQARAKWSEEWRKSPDVVAYEKERADQKYYPIVVGPDGRFRVEDVVAGTYVLNVQVFPPRGSDGRDRIETMASATQEFTVAPLPTGRDDQPLDLGSIGLTTRLAVRAGEAAPAFTATTVDGKPLSLTDFRGKYVLVDFWATWCGPCVAEIPFLKNTYNAFSNDSRFAMVSLSLDEKPESPRQFAANQGLKWTQGFLGDWSTTDIPNQWGVHGIPAVFLIGPDGRILASGLRGDATKARVAEALK